MKLRTDDLSNPESDKVSDSEEVMIENLTYKISRITNGCPRGAVLNAIFRLLVVWLLESDDKQVEGYFKCIRQAREALKMKNELDD